MENLTIIGLCLLSLTVSVNKFVQAETIASIENNVKQYLQDIGPTKLIKSGSFQAAEHETVGTAKLVQAENGRYYIEFEKNFQTDRGPDLFVILHTSPDILATSEPKRYPLEQKDYYMVSPLLKVKGEQRYILPGNIEMDKYNSVAIWCRQFNATFGAASLNKNR